VCGPCADTCNPGTLNTERGLLILAMTASIHQPASPRPSEPSSNAVRGRGSRVLGATFSAFVGACARTTLPRSFRIPAYKTFARAVGADLTEVEKPLDSYHSLGDFFARRLRSDARRLEVNFAGMLSPCDGQLGAGGVVENGTLIQAKGRHYSLEALVVDHELAASLEGGVYRTVYLSPRDYHRVHAPYAGRLISYCYIPGALWPVSKPFVDRVDQVFASNERAVLHVETAHGPLVLVMVAAAGVGNLWLSKWGQSGRDTRQFRHNGEIVFENVDREVEVGDELGAFQLGSTVVAVLGNRHADVTGATGSQIRLGQPLISFVSATGRRSDGVKSL
jgi:phosphatidylserine decarboxylase